MFTWDPRLATGVAELDEQHQLLFRRADAVLEAVEAGQATADVARAIQFLADYAALHFETEERYMLASAYPDLDAHRGWHEELERRIGRLASTLENEGPTMDLVAELRSVIRGWLSQHIAEKDRALADWLSRSARRG